MNNLEKQNHEKDIVKMMIIIYCHQHHHPETELCHQCQELLEYATKRIDQCPVMATKSFCSFCQIHCYSPEMRAKIKTIMRYSGPRMLRYHPLLTIKHGMISLKDKIGKNRK